MKRGKVTPVETRMPIGQMRSRLYRSKGARKHVNKRLPLPLLTYEEGAIGLSLRLPTADDHTWRATSPGL